MTVVVLGWDALDYRVAGELGLRDSFGEYHADLETFENPVLEKPHTYEIWPSIITGLSPEEHGIHADNYTHGGSWSSTWLNIATVVSSYTVPERIRWYVGRKIRERGHTFEMESEEYYKSNSINTLFDEGKSASIAIPNHRSKLDEELGVSSDRGADLAQYLNIDTDQDGQTVHRPKVPVEVLEQRLSSEVGQKVGAVRAGLDRNYDLIFVWLGYLDTIGHLAPVVNEDKWKRRAYEQAADWTEFLRTRLSNEDILICISDHGLIDGSHSPHAYIGSSDEALVKKVDSVLDFHDIVGGEITSSSTEETDETDAREAEAVRDRLEDLGYI